jgi:hypothetical protein
MALADTPGPAVAVVTPEERTYVDWPAIFAGTAVATAISFVLLTFGSAIGLSLTSAYEGAGISLTGFAIAAALWLVWVQVSGFFAGGYLTGRMRRRIHDASEHESDIRDGVHGLTMWAVGLLLGAFLAFSGATAVVSGAANAVGAAAGTATEAAASLVDDNELLIDRALRGTQAGTPAVATGTAPAGDDPAPAIGRLLVSAVGDGTLDDADRQYLVETIAARAGIPPEEAQQRVEQLWTQAQQLEAEARAAADRARQFGVLVAFMTAASLLIGAVAAYFGAVMGGNHRDKQVVFEDMSRPW